jgi:hypothetical protein
MLMYNEGHRLRIITTRLRTKTNTLQTTDQFVAIESEELQS